MHKHTVTTGAIVSILVFLILEVIDMITGTNAYGVNGWLYRGPWIWEIIRALYTLGVEVELLARIHVDGGFKKGDPVIWILIVFCLFGIGWGAWSTWNGIDSMMLNQQGWFPPGMSFGVTAFAKFMLTSLTSVSEFMAIIGLNLSSRAANAGLAGGSSGGDSEGESGDDSEGGSETETIESA